MHLLGDSFEDGTDESAKQMDARMKEAAEQMGVIYSKETEEINMEDFKVNSILITKIPPNYKTVLQSTPSHNPGHMWLKFLTFKINESLLQCTRIIPDEDPTKTYVRHVHPTHHHLRTVRLRKNGAHG